MNYDSDSRGYFGEFGGAFIPEMLQPNIEELQKRYLSIIADPGFQAEFQGLLSEYAGRPTPLFHAERLSAKYGFKVYLKREDLLHTGAHKINNTIGQILLAKRLGKKRIIAETGAGQHGVATATVCALKGLECVVYMGAVDVERQNPNVMRMRMLGASVVPVYSGSQTLKDATNEAMRDWIANADSTHYIIGSVVGPHPFPDMVRRFQEVTGREVREQLLKKEGRELPDYVLACVGGGSNSMGIFHPFLYDTSVKLVGIEAAGHGISSGKSAATIALGTPGILHGSRTLLLQTKDGQVEEAHSLSAGLDYPGVGPQHSHLARTGRVKYTSVTDDDALEGAFLLSRLEGIIPALESAHAVACLEKLEARPGDTVVVNISGRGDKDMAAYIKSIEERGL